MLAKNTMPAGSVCWNRTRRRCSKTAIWAPVAEALYTVRGRPPPARGFCGPARSRRRVAGAQRAGGCARARPLRPVWALAHVLAHLGDREVQPALPLLHARGGRPAPTEGRPALLRGDRALGGAVRAAGRPEDPGDGRGAARPAGHRRPGRAVGAAEGAGAAAP